jgi:putative tryptophan/tyrosine transport system substrate-binding protein
MRRREFIMLVGGSAAAWPLAARGQQPGGMRRVGVLLGLAEGPEAKSRVQAFRLGLRDLGWLEGRNVAIDYRYGASDLGLIKRYAKELVGLAPDVIVANSTPVLAALRQATSSIPIIFSVVNDPVGQGFISSLARPGANITGFTFIEFEIVGKWIDLLNDVVPNLHRVAVMFDPDTSPYYDRYLRSFKATKPPALTEIEAAHVRDIADVDLAIAKLGRESGSGLIAPGDIFIVDQREAIIKSARDHGVPIISVYRSLVVEGGLMSYGPDTSDIFRRSSAYVARILKGESPADLPAQSPVKYELVINLKTARVLGLTIPQHLLLLADEVIE